MKVCVIGGGISGLSAAYRLLEGGADVELLEGSTRVGGWLGSEQIDGAIVETGADSILSEKPWALTLARDLGLSDEIISTRPARRGAFVVRAQKLARVPEGFSLLAPADLSKFARSTLLSPRGRARTALDLVLPRSHAEDESLESFVVRRLGRELFDRLAQPLAGGIYGADPNRLSLRATMPRFLDLEQKYGSVIRGLRARVTSEHDTQAASGARYGLFAAFRGGMQALVDALERALQGRIRTSSPVTSLARDEQGFRVEVGGEFIRYDALVMALPAHRAAKALAGFDPELSRALGDIEYASAATVTLSWPREAIPHALDAFGFVVPTVEGRSVIASTWASVKWEGRAPAGKAVLRVFFGGHRGQHLVDYGDSELIQLARRELGLLVGVSAEPDWTRVKRFVRAMPQYHLGHLERVDRIEQRARRHARFALAGNAYRGVGIPDAVKSGEQAARSLLEAERGASTRPEPSMSGAGA
jgi:protoporphyrinogen/coproporphyrinogen III oxidase